MEIEGKRLDGSRAYVIFEAGHNHGGSLKTAEKMLRAAAAAGCDAFKLQKRSNLTLYTRAAYDAPYASENAYGPTYGAHREALEFGRPEYARLKALAAQLGISLFATAFDVESVDFCVDLGLPALKIASGDLTNHPLLAYAASTGLPLLVSTGGANLDQVKAALDVVLAYEVRVCLMQCTAMYPCPWERLDLRVIQSYQDLPVDAVGASLHDNGVAMAVAAYALGARVIEKHGTLDRTMKGTDHAFSLEPQGMAKMVRDLRRVEQAMGDGLKRPWAEEAPAIIKMSKSAYSTTVLHAGHVICADDIVFRSPGGHLAPSVVPDILLGRTLLTDMAQEEAFELAHVSASVEVASSR